MEVGHTIEQWLPREAKRRSGYFSFSGRHRALPSIKKHMMDSPQMEIGLDAKHLKG